MDMISIRIDQPLAERIEHLRKTKHLNVSSFAREALIAALDREFPAEVENLSRLVSRT